LGKIVDKTAFTLGKTYHRGRLTVSGKVSFVSHRTKTGVYQTFQIGGEVVRAFTPHPLPPKNPPLLIEGGLAETLHSALAALSRLKVASAMVPSPQWFLYGFVRKEAVISSQIEGTQSTLENVISFELSRQAGDVPDVEEVCNYVDALTYARAELARPKGLPLSRRLVGGLHKRLMKGVRCRETQPGKIRTSQNWIGGTRSEKEKGTGVKSRIDPRPLF
jgi:Fic family protein